ncbi:hypothetical protein VTN00DRAFT_5771 [Thermoascus crustaceus]|uniref:uncharacterized protein n=1 Tax=Thermoascus crustaceus TaxID=5088 RepID=UPI003741FFCB
MAAHRQAVTESNEAVKSRSSGKEQNRPPKRQKIALACEECRERKVRCDGARPVCGTCMRRHNGQELCKYPMEIPKLSSQRQYIEILQERIRQLEEICRVRDSLPSPARSNDRTVQSRSLPPPDPRHTDSLSTLLLPTPKHQDSLGAEPNSSLLSRHRDGENAAADREPSSAGVELLDGFRNQDGSRYGPEELDEQSPINAMGATSLVPGEIQSASEDFYGKSSAASFFNQVQEAFFRHSGEHNPFSLSESPSSGGSWKTVVGNSLSEPFNPTSSSKLKDYSLPPRALADHLLDAYRRLWRPDNEVKGSDAPSGVGLGASDCPRSVFYCALNTIFALGSQFSEESFAERAAMSGTFFNRSRRLLQIDILDHGNLALVQTLLIMAQYLQSTNLPSRCWNVVGFACRVAHSLGLHLNHGDDKKCTLHQEIRRRTWYGCVVLDAVLSMTLGRPTVTSHDTTVPLPSTIDDENLSADSSNCVQPANVFSRTTFFVQAIKLYRILDKILSKIYKPWNEATRGTTTDEERVHISRVDVIIQLDAELTNFETNLPDALHWSRGAQNRDGILLRQTNVLHARFLLLRMLIYRPVFVQLCQRSSLSQQSSTFSSRTHDDSDANTVMFTFFAQRSAVTCIEAAVGLINLISRTSQTPQTGAWWYNLYYIFTSAMVLTLAELCPPVRQTIDSDSLARSWQQCQDTLARMTEYGPAVRQYYRILQVMQKVVRFGGQSQLSTDSSNNELDGMALPNGSRVAHRNASSYPGAPLSAVPDAESSNDNQLEGDADLTDFLWKDCWSFSSNWPINGVKQGIPFLKQQHPQNRVMKSTPVALLDFSSSTSQQPFH